MLNRIRRAVDNARAASPMIGWRWVIAEHALRRMGVREVPIRVRGLTLPAYCRIGTSDIYEFSHLLGISQEPISLPFRPQIIVDAGANVGYSALRFQKEFPGSTIIGIEPEHRNALQFEKNCAPYPNIKLERKALWPSDTSISIRSSDAHTNAFQVEEDATGDIEGVSIPTLMAKHGLSHIDLLKIDIEGSEKRLFSDPLTKQWLPLVSMMLVETHDRFEPGCSETVRGVVEDLFDYRGIVDEYECYVAKRLGVVLCQKAS